MFENLTSRAMPSLNALRAFEAMARTGRATLAAEELNVEVAHAERAASRFANQREGLDEESIERLAAAGAIAEPQALFAELMIGKLLETGLQLGDLRQAGGPLRQAVARNGPDRASPAAGDT